MIVRVSGPAGSGKLAVIRAGVRTGLGVQDACVTDCSQVGYRRASLLVDYWAKDVREEGGCFTGAEAVAGKVIVFHEFQSLSQDERDELLDKMGSADNCLFYVLETT